jgi:hypothetical protein
VPAIALNNRRVGVSVSICIIPPNARSHRTFESIRFPDPIEVFQSAGMQRRQKQHFGLAEGVVRNAGL